MWEKIKKFFKWIADHTGISWIARKISSGWKWLFGGKANATQQNTSQQGESPEGEEHDQSKTTTPKLWIMKLILINQHQQQYQMNLKNLWLIHLKQISNQQEII